MSESGCGIVSISLRIDWLVFGELFLLGCIDGNDDDDDDNGNDGEDDDVWIKRPLILGSVEGVQKARQIAGG